MDRATYESQKAFAGDKIPSMQRRCVDNDYTERRMYMITMVTEGRKALFGEVTGRSEATEPSPDAPHIVLTRLGEAVAQAWHDISTYHPEVEVVALQMMPDHLHGILFVKEKMEKPLGKVLLGFKQGCNKAFRELLPTKLSMLLYYSNKQNSNKQTRLSLLLYHSNPQKLQTASTACSSPRATTTASYSAKASWSDGCIT